MVAVIEKVEKLGRRSGLCSASSGLILVILIYAGGTDLFSEGPAQWMRKLSSWPIGIWFSIILPIILVLGSSWASGLQVARYTLRGFAIGFLWALIAAYIDLLVMLIGVEIGRVVFTGEGSFGSLMLLDEYSIILLFTSIYAFFPILIVALLRTIWLRKYLGHERVLW